MQSLASLDYRKAWLDRFLDEANVARKREAFRRAEVYNRRQAPYIVEKLEEEFPEATVRDMRKVLSLNIAHRITDKMASVYHSAPVRTFVDETGEKVSTEGIIPYIETMYEAAKLNTKLLRANRIKKFQNQAILQVVPAGGIIDVRVFQPHQVDCIPLDSDPEQPFAFIISAYDPNAQAQTGKGKKHGKDDPRTQMRFVWWSAEHNMITDGNGEIVQEDPADILNPIGELPFVDIPDPKENEFWVRKGNGIIDFSIDFGVIISDIANINRLQGYAQAVVSSIDKPTDFKVGPNQVLWLKQDPNSDVQPSFQFVTPSPDLNAGLELLFALLNIFMTSEGVDPKTITAKADGRNYSSGIERLLAMIEAFEASRDDLEQFRWVEQEVLRLFILWSNHFQGARNSPLRYTGPTLPESLYVTVKYAEPQAIRTQAEIEQSELKLVETGLRSKVQALMAIDGIDEAAAIERLEKMREHQGATPDTGAAPGTAAPDGTTAPAVPAVDGAAKVADTALNGAQVTALVEIVQAVSAGQIPRESAVNIVETAFLIDRASADRLIGPAGKGFTPTPPPETPGAA